VAKENEAASAAGPAEAAAPTRRRPRFLLLILITLFVLVLAGGGAYFFLFGKKKEAGPAEEPPPPPKTFVYYNLPGFVVNLPTSAAGRTSFLKVTLSLELDSVADVASVQAVMPRVIDRLQTYLRELRPDDLRGTAALSRLREELLVRVTAAAPGAKVNDVLLQELLLQ
jgi:flagellar FliL protein